ncbi:hypothetical protein Tco_0606831 [Tanacetum coccineum]
MSTTKTKAAQYDLPGIEDKVPNIWSPIKVAYDKYALWGISHWREQRKSFYAYARGMQSRGDVYSTKRIMAVTHVKAMRKHGYGYLEETIVRRADNVLYRFKEGDDVADFAIVLRMFTRSLIIQKRVEDLQLGVESYQKKINITKLDTTRPDLRKRHPYTPYKDPQGFIYVDDYKRNRHYQEYRHGVLAKEKMKHIGKEKSSFHDQGHQQAAKGKEDDEEFGEICFQNPFYLQKAQQSKPKLYVGDIIVQTNPIVIPDSEETLALDEESRSKMLLKHKDNMMLEKKKKNSVNSSEPTLSIRPTNVVVPKELPKVRMVNTTLKKLKHHLANFDVVVKERTTPRAITEGS